MDGDSVTLQCQSKVSNTLSTTKKILTIPSLIVIDGLAIGIGLFLAYVIRTFVLPELFP